MKSARCCPSLGLVFALLTGPLFAANSDWTTWRGPSNAGLAPDAQPPLKWSGQQNIKWKTKIPGYGYSTPIILKDRIYLLTAIETGPGAGGPRGAPNPTVTHEWAVVALERATGKIAWQKTARRQVPHEGHHPTNSFASSSPTTDGERLYVSFGSRGLYCYDLQGNLIWEKDLGDMKTRMGFGEGASPALAGDMLIMPWDQEENSFVVGLNKKTGEEVWRQSRQERSSWSTPLIVEVGGRQQAIIPASRATRSYDAKTGEVIWEAAGLTGNVIPMPVIGHDMAYVMSGFQGYSIQAIKLSSKGDISGTDNIAWHVRRSAPYVASPVLSGDRLYMGKSTDAFLSCLNAKTGEVHYQDQRLEGLNGLYSSPIAANGYLYVTGRNGTTLVLKDGPKYEVVSSNVLGEEVDASLVMLGKELFLRGHEHLYCIAEG